MDNKGNRTRVMLEVSLDNDIYMLDKSTVLVGDKTFNDIYFPAEEIAKAYQTINKKPLNINHSRKIEDEVGYCIDAEWNEELKKMSVIPIINRGLDRSSIALKYIENRRRIGRTPELSVGVWCDINQEMIDSKVVDTARNLEFDHLAIVTAGACSSKDGCGIGMNKTPGNKEMIEASAELITLGIVPSNPPGYKTADENTEWSAPTLADFTGESWDDLTDAEKRGIASCYAWAPKNPPDKFTDLKLPHHRPSDKAVVWNGVRSAYAAIRGARGGVDIPAGDVNKVIAHLKAHYKDFDKEFVEESDIKMDKEIKKLEDEPEPEPEPSVKPEAEPEKPEEESEVEPKTEDINTRIDKLESGLKDITDVIESLKKVIDDVREKRGLSKTLNVKQEDKQDAPTMLYNELKEKILKKIKG